MPEQVALYEEELIKAKAESISFSEKVLHHHVHYEVIGHILIMSLKVGHINAVTEITELLTLCAQYAVPIQPLQLEMEDESRPHLDEVFEVSRP